MGFRFRKRLKLASGIYLNMGTRGVSCSLGIKKIGLSYSGKIISSSSNKNKNENKMSSFTEINNKNETYQEKINRLSASKMKLNTDTGDLTFFDMYNVELKKNDRDFILQYQKEKILNWLKEEANEINGDIDFLLNIYFDCPDLNMEHDFLFSSFELEKPLCPENKIKSSMPIPETIKPLGFFKKMLKSQRLKHENAKIKLEKKYANDVSLWKENANNLRKDYLEKYNNWITKRNSYISELNTNVCLIEKNITNMLNKLTWARETLIDFEITDNGETIWIDIDLPEIDDIPKKEATVSSNGDKLIIKNKSKKQIQLEYAKHVHGIAFRIACHSLAYSPKTNKIIISGYSQRLNKATGKINDDYLYSIIFDRETLKEINFKNLKNIDPVMVFDMFESIRKISYSGDLKKITPFSPVST